MDGAKFFEMKQIEDLWLLPGYFVEKWWNGLLDITGN
jgi:hypothetical protein